MNSNSQSTGAPLTIDPSKTPRRFRNELYEYLTANGATEDTASRIASEAELWVTAFQAWELRDIETALGLVGFMGENHDQQK